MSVDSTRDQLIRLEYEQREETERLDLERQNLQQLLESIDSKDQAVAERRATIREARRTLQREEALEAVASQVGSIEDIRGSLVESFQAIAEGKPWYVGTGNADTVLDHQWTGMMFGAVAQRWILGDWPGLGKTRTSIGWLDLIGARKVIIIAPPDICDQFAGEALTLAPHRTVTNLYHMTKDRRHVALDIAVSMSEGVIIVNYEIWRQDKDTLAKLMGWQADTVILDEAHNIKSKKSANYRNIETLVTVDNTCPVCGNLMKGLYDPEYLAHKPPRKVPVPCSRCEWKKGKPTELSYSNALVEWLSTKSVQNLLLMTGTPILNDPADLFPLLHLCDPILFTTENNFRDTYCRKDHHADKWEFRAHAVDNLRPLIEGRFLARTYEDAGVIIPEQHVHVIPVDLDKNLYPLQYRTIQQISKEAQILLDSGEQMTIMHLIALITRKRQANVWPGGIEIRDSEGNVTFSAGAEVQESVKLDWLIDNILSKHDEGHRQVVFSQFKTALAELEIRLVARGIRVVRLDGSTPKALREEIKTNFYRAKGEEAKWDVLLANYKTGGVGLNLTSATVTHILDEEWNPGKRDQAYRRTDRIGQTEASEVYVYRIPGTIDTWMSNGIHRKEMMIAGFTEAMTEENDISVSTFLQALNNGEIL